MLWSRLSLSGSKDLFGLTLAPNPSAGALSGGRRGLNDVHSFLRILQAIASLLVASTVASSLYLSKFSESNSMSWLYTCSILSYWSWILFKYSKNSCPACDDGGVPATSMAFSANEIFRVRWPFSILIVWHRDFTASSLFPLIPLILDSDRDILGCLGIHYLPLRHLIILTISEQLLFIQCQLLLLWFSSVS